MEKAIKILAFRFAKLSNRKTNTFTDDFKIDYYLFQAILSDSFKILVALVINLITGTLTEFLIIVTVFGSLRFLTGGFHASSFNNCFVITLILFTIPPILANILINNINVNKVSLTVLMICFLIINILYSPKFLVEVSKIKMIIYKTFSILYLLSAYIVAVNFKEYSMAIYIGILIQLVTVTPVMYVISNKLKNRGETL
jgi:accessory gene regulator B